MVITQEPTQSLTALHRPGAAEGCITGEQQDVVLPLMIALSMVTVSYTHLTLPTIYSV